MAFGSFATMAQYRLPRNKPWSSVPMMKGEKIHCPHCKHVLEFKDWCPVIGFLRNRGKCKFCAVPISRYYLFTEFGITFLSIVNALTYGFEQQYTPMMLMGAAVVVLIVIEMEYRQVPERILVWMLFAALIHRMLLTQEMNMILISAVAGVIIVMALDKLHQRFTKEPLPLEYSKLLTLGGIALPLTMLPAFFGTAALLMYATSYIWQRYQGEGRIPYALPISLALLLTMYITTVLPVVAAF